MQTLSVVFPAWNEADGIERAVNAARHAADSLVNHGEIGSFEIVIVDDGSTDQTAEIADRLALEDTRVIVVHHEENRTLGATLRSGFDASTGDVICYTDADLPFDLMELGKAFRLMRDYGADIISLYRHDRTGEGPRRMFYSYVYNSLVRIVLGLRVRDVNFAGKLISREVLDDIELVSEGSFIDAELLARAQRRGFQTIQFGVDYFPRSRGVSSLSSTPVIVKILSEMRAVAPQIRALQRR